MTAGGAGAISHRGFSQHPSAGPGERQTGANVKLAPEGITSVSTKKKKKKEEKLSCGGF